MKNTVRVVAAVVNTAELTLYIDDGSILKIPQGDPRLRKIIDAVTPIVAAGGIAEISLDEHNHYKEFEEKTNGLVQFFKVAKNKLASFFKQEAKKEVVPQVIGSIPQEKPATEPKTEVKTSAEVQKLNSAVDEIMKHAKPVHSNDQLKEEETVIAVVDKKVIPDVQNIKGQITASLQTGTKGVEAFMARVAAVASKRNHSAQDLMKFLQKGDLPIADDGSIIIYKVLRLKSNGKHTYVDCHTRNVPQRVGSYVHMDESLVDPNRRNECSNGLHVARRGYVGGFSGDVCVIAKVAPEDVIAVPQYDANKMRVCGYHILFQLSDDDFQKLRKNQPITDTADGKLLIGRAIAGDHPPPIENVKITEHGGRGIQITPLQAAKAPVVEVKPAVALNVNGEVNAIQADVVSPIDVSRMVTEGKLGNQVPEEPQTSVKEADLVPPVPTVPETKLGAPKPDVTPVATAIQAVATSKGMKMAKVPLAPAPTPVTKLIPASPDHAPGGAHHKTATKSVAKELVNKVPEIKKAKESLPQKSGPRQQIRDLFDKKILNIGQAEAVLKIKKAAKKSWEALGVTEEEQKLLERYLGK